jgi:hypothetical protein
MITEHFSIWSAEPIPRMSPIESLDLAAAAQVCQELRVELRPAPPEGYPSLECVAKPGEPMSDAVERVAKAIDRMFALAMRRDLK